MVSSCTNMGHRIHRKHRQRSPLREQILQHGAREPNWIAVLVERDGLQAFMLAILDNTRQLLTPNKFTFFREDLLESY